MAWQRSLSTPNLIARGSTTEDFALCRTSRHDNSLLLTNNGSDLRFCEAGQMCQGRVATIAALYRHAVHCVPKALLSCMMGKSETVDTLLEY